MGKAKKSIQSAATESLTQFRDPLQAVQNLITLYGQKGVIVGGIASSLLGTPRYTVDIDIVLLINAEDMTLLISNAKKLGIISRIDDAEGFARKNSVLLLRHEISGTDIDVIIGSLPFEIEMVEHGQVVLVGGLGLRLPIPEDLIIMKTVAHREKDLADIRAIAASHPDLDNEYIHSWVTQFEKALDRSDLWEKTSTILN